MVFELQSIGIIYYFCNEANQMKNKELIRGRKDVVININRISWKRFVVKWPHMMCSALTNNDWFVSIVLYSFSSLLTNSFTGGWKKFNILYAYNYMVSWFKCQCIKYIYMDNAIYYMHIFFCETFKTSAYIIWEYMQIYASVCWVYSLHIFSYIYGEIWYCVTWTM